MANVVHMTYHRKDDNMLVTCIHSFRKVCPDDIIVLTCDGLPDEVSKRLDDQYRVFFDWVKPGKMVKRRATCKIEQLDELVHRALNGQIVLVSDVDVVFLKDPFKAMEDQTIDLGLTTRGYQHLFPINGGIFYIRVGASTREWTQWHVREVHHPNWPSYVQHRKACHHEHFGLDWSVGQDFLVTCWNNKDWLKRAMNVQVADVGPFYNYCPPTDTMGDKAFEMAWEALKEQNVAVLHLKSELKKMLYDERFPDAQLHYPRGTWAWL